MQLKAWGSGAISTNSYLQQIAWLGSSDQNGPGERVDDAGIDGIENGLGYAGVKLTVESVAGFQHDLFTFVNLQHGRDVWMPAIVACDRLLTQRLAAIDVNARHGLNLPDSVGLVRQYLVRQYKELLRCQLPKTYPTLPQTPT